MAAKAKRFPGLEGHKLQKEDDEAFHVQGPDGTAFKVAKGHLHHATVERIRQHFDDGGDVQPDATPADDDLLGKVFQGEGIDLPAVGSGLKNVITQGVLPVPGPASVIPALAKMGSAAVDTIANAPSEGTSTSSAEEAEKAARAAALNAEINGPPVSPPVQTSTPPENPIVLPGADPAIAAGAKQEMAGIDAGAKAQGDLGTAEAAAAQQRLDAAASLKQNYDARMAAHAQRVQQMQDNILAHPIDPAGWWQSIGAGGRVMGTIGQILGGIAQGFGAKSNPAQDIMDREINNDLAAQKENLGTRKTILGSYLEQGHDMTSAYQLAKADLMDRTAAQIQKAAGTLAGPAAQAKALQLKGSVAQQTAQMRSEAESRSLANYATRATLPGQLEMNKLGVAQARQTMDLTGRLMNATSGQPGAGFPPAALELPAFAPYRERKVTLPDGSIGFAADKDAAKEVQKSIDSASELQKNLQSYAAIKSPATTDRGAAETAYNGILLSMGKLHDLGRFSDTEYELYKKALPDRSDLIKPFAQQKLAELGREIDTKMQIANSKVLRLNR